MIVSVTCIYYYLLPSHSLFTTHNKVLFMKILWLLFPKILTSIVAVHLLFVCWIIEEED